MENTCPKCGGTMQAGYGDVVGVLRPATYPIETARLTFVVRGEPTASNPIKAFVQGINDSPMEVAYRINGQRCSICGFVEFYANERA